MAGAATPDHWTLNAFRRRHAKELNDLFTQLVELAWKAKMGKLGHVAIDSTRIAANASRNRIDTEQVLRDARARVRRDIRHWQRQCDREDPNEGVGVEVGGEVRARLEDQLEQIPERLERLHKAGLKKLSRTDPDSGFLRQRGGFTLGYTATLAVSGDHVILAQRVTRETNDNEPLVPMVEAVGKECREKPERARADSGSISSDNLKALEETSIDAYVPGHLFSARVELRRSPSPARTASHTRASAHAPEAAPSGGPQDLAARKADCGAVFAALKEERGLRHLARQGLRNTPAELAWPSPPLYLDADVAPKPVACQPPPQ
jgi:hypothetical protein